MPISLKVNYFAHDYGARYSPKLIALQMGMGALGLAIFWCLIEVLWENAGYYPCAYETISYHLRWATPEDVRRVVEEFNLFRTDGKVFWSDSVLRRMEVRQTLSEKRANSGREGGLQSGVARREKASASKFGSNNEANASSTGSNRGAGVSQSCSNKENNNIKNDINKESSSHTEDEKMMIFELFFWSNLMSPEYEANRFWQHYEKSGWTTSDGSVIDDKERIAKYWKPEQEGKRFSPDFLQWYKSVVLAAKNHLSAEVANRFMRGLVRAILSGHDLLITYASKDLAEIVSSFLNENELYGSYNIELKYEN